MITMIRMADRGRFIKDISPSWSRLMQSLMEKGPVVEVVGFGPQSRNFSNHMNYTNNFGTKTVLILGETEMAEGKVSVKDMETGEQKTVEVFGFLKEIEVKK